MVIYQKALDYNKLLNDQAQGKLLKKYLKYPLFAGIKYDGNLVVVVVDPDSSTTFITSGGHIYTNDHSTVFEKYPPGVYTAERIGTNGKLGDRVNCNLRGPRGDQVSYGHTYKVHDMVSYAEYTEGISMDTYGARRERLRSIAGKEWVTDRVINTREELEQYLDAVVAMGYEGIMIKDPNWFWERTKSRRIDMVKYKRRPTADLYCTGVTEGEGKYEDMIGALQLEDSAGRKVSVGSGLSDWERTRPDDYFVGEVIEIEYEQIIDTYIQPTYIQVRPDKTIGDIDG